MSVLSEQRFGRYEAREEIGDGAMGRVHRGFDPLVRRPVAIKTVKSEFLTRDTRDEYLRRFRREAQAAGMLSHASIVSIFDVGDDYIVMEFVEGVSLADLLKHRGHLELPEALRLLSAVADAIDYAHRNGVIHRDIKPANIMVQPEGRPKLMDFGVARIETSAMTSGGHFFGSPSYMAPEQILGAEITPRADLFSFAIVAYETVAGQRPFQADGISAIVYRVVHSQPPPPSACRPDLPEYYDAIFRKALAKDPAHRFPSAAAFMTALYGNDLEALVMTVPPEPFLDVPRSEERPAAEVETHALESMPPARHGTPLLLGAAVLAGLGLAVAAPRVKAPVAVPQVSAAGMALRIETVPPGATVWLDDTALGEAPVDVAALEPGRHRVRVARDGYAPAQLSLEIQAGTPPPPLQFVMTPLATLVPTDPEPPRAATASLTVSTGARAATAKTVSPPPPVAGRGQPEPLLAAWVHELEHDPNITRPRRLSGPEVRYPEAARRLRFGGMVLVEMVVTERGRPEDVRVLHGAGDVLDRAVVDAVRGWKFEPARKGGRPVRVRWRYSQNFDPSA